MKLASLLGLSIVGLGVAACGGADSSNADNSGSGGASSATSSGSGSGSTTTGSGSGGSEVAPLAPPDRGIQLATTAVKLKPGEEKYLCWSEPAPSDPLSVVKIEVQTPAVGVHHYGVFTNAAKPPKDPSGYECTKMGITWGLVNGGGVGTPGVGFPEGTAMTLPTDTQIILQLHLLNTTSDTLEVDPVRVNLDAGDPNKTYTQVGLLIAGTLDITIPPSAANYDVDGGCDAPEPMENIFAVFPHMHQLGRHIEADITPASSGKVEMVNNQDWNFGTQGVYPVKNTAAMGDKVHVTCTYDNDSTNTVHFGLSTHDEMCLEVLYYYPATRSSQYCGF